MHPSKSPRRILGPVLCLFIFLTNAAWAEVVDYDNIVGTTTLIQASGPTPNSPVQISIGNGGVWNMYCREDPVGTITNASAGLSINTASKEVAISYQGETYAVPSPVVYTNVAGFGILVKASASESWFEPTGPSVDTRYTNSASFTFLTNNIGREFTGTVTEKQEYMRNGQILGTCIEKYRIVGRVTPAPGQSTEVTLIDWLKGLVRDVLIDEDKSDNSRKTSGTVTGVRG